MLKSNKLNSITQITQDDIKHVVGASCVSAALYSLVYVASIGIAAVCTYRCAITSLGRKHPYILPLMRGDIKVARMDKW